MKKELFNELLESAKQAKAIEQGKLKSAREFCVNPRTEIVKEVPLKIATKHPNVLQEVA